MADVTALDTVRGLYDYHWWANRRLFEVSAALGEEAASRDLGRQFSFPTLRRMWGHVYGADWIWLARWNGVSPTTLPGGEFATMGRLRECWDAFEKDQRAFVEALAPADLGRVVAYSSTEGEPFRLPLWQLLQHVPNHATHHRSEIATMVTMISGSPPETGMVTFGLLGSGQGDMSRRWA